MLCRLMNAVDATKRYCFGPYPSETSCLTAPVPSTQSTAAEVALVVTEPPTAALRMAGRHAWLLPRSLDEADVAVWLVELQLREVAAGHALTMIPVEPNARAEFLSELLPEIAETAGWSLPVAAPEDAHALQPESVAPVVQMPSAYRMAAIRFLSWVRENNRCGTYEADRVAALYREHAAAIGAEPASIDHMKGELRQLPGVSTEVADKAAKGNRKSRRERGVKWHLSPDMPGQADDDDAAIPFDLPRRSGTWEPLRLAA